MLSLLVQMIEILILVLIVVAIVNRFGRNPRRHTVVPMGVPRLNNRSAPSERAVELQPAQTQPLVQKPTADAQAVPTGKVRVVGRGKKVVRLEEFARGEEIVTRVSQFGRGGKQVGETNERAAPIEQVVDSVVK